MANFAVLRLSITLIKILTKRCLRLLEALRSEERERRMNYCLKKYADEVQFLGARSRTRTGTDLSVRGILSPLCLPIPPSGRKYFQ